MWSLLLRERSPTHSSFFQGSDSLLSAPGILVLTLNGPSVSVSLKITQWPADSFLCQVTQYLSLIAQLQQFCPVEEYLGC